MLLLAVELDGNSPSSPEGGVVPDGGSVSSPEGGVVPDGGSVSLPEGGVVPDGGFVPDGLKSKKLQLESIIAQDISTSNNKNNIFFFFMCILHFSSLQVQRRYRDNAHIYATVQQKHLTYQENGVCWQVFRKVRDSGSS